MDSNIYYLGIMGYLKNKEILEIHLASVRSLALLGQAEGPKATTKTRPPDL
jgi:hypothetical protein